MGAQRWSSWARDEVVRRERAKRMGVAKNFILRGSVVGRLVVCWMSEVVLLCWNVVSLCIFCSENPMHPSSLAAATL